MKLICAFVVGALGASSLAHATALNLTPGRPDVSSSFISISYNAATRALSATGSSQNLVLTQGGMSQSVNGGAGSWTLNAIINNDGTIGGAASFSVSGHYPTLADPLVVLMSSSTISQFGNSFGLLEFVFSNGTGQLNMGLPTGIILNDPPQANTFTSNWSVTSTASADTFVVPAPTTALMGVCGTMCLSRRRRR